MRRDDVPGAAMNPIDAHVHLWDPEALSYPWLQDHPSLLRRFAYEDAPDGIFVECNVAPGQELDEVRLVDPRIRGIVAFADVELFDAYQEMGRVVGVRHNIQGNPPGFCATLVHKVREAGRRGFTFDLCATHDQLPEVIELARRCPDTRLVLDHCGKPDIAGRQLDPWRGDIRTLAQLPHVHCKLSGLLTEAGPAWNDGELIPYADHVLQSFGSERLIFGGDWPVVTLAGTWDEWYQFTLRFTARWADAERLSFYRDNALRFYGLAPAV